MRGPVPKPVALRALEGNPGKRPLGKHPEPPPCEPDCPEWLSVEAMELWEQVAPELADLSLLTALDAAALAVLCESFATWRRSVATLAQGGETYQAGELVKRHPAAAVATQAAKDALALFQQFGMTPASRCRLHTPAVGRELDALEEFLREAT